MTQEAFHFLRPDWLWALIPAAVLGWFLIRNMTSGAADGWTKHVDRHLLRHLAISGTATKRSRLLPIAGAVMICATILGLAGPTWQKADVPSFEGGEPVVAVLSLAQSMNSDDLTPTRLKRSVHKLRDVLARTQGDQRGLVIYSDRPFVAAPLTNDPKVIEEMLPELSTSLMPVLGNRLDLAIREAQAMLERSHATRGQIIVMADDAGNDPTASVAAAKAAQRAGYSVSVLGAGTEAGATLQTADGRAIAGRDGQTFTAALDKTTLKQVAQAGGGVFSMITAGNADLDRVLPHAATQQAAGDQQDFQADAWVDMGYWLLLVPVLLIPFAFRRGLVFGLAFLFAGAAMQPETAQAGTWDDLWATPDQQGQAAFATGQHADAARLFEAPEWQGAAAYRAGDYASATKGFAAQDYNRGNALAKSGQFEAALTAYDAALAQNPDDQDAQFNRDLIVNLLEQQQEQQNDAENQDQESGEGDQQNSGNSEQGQSESEQEQDQKSGQMGSETQDQDAGDGSQSESQSNGEQQEPEQTEPGESGHKENSQQSENTEQQSEGSEGHDQAEQGEASQKPESAEQQPENSEGNDQANETGQNTEEVKPANQQAQNSEGQDESDIADNGEETGLAERLSDLLTQEPEEDPSEMFSGSVSGAKPVNQAIEQQLRRVPDDPSGLLRARIRQHYARTRSGS